MAKNKIALGLNGFGWAHAVFNQPYDFDKIMAHAKKLGFDGLELFEIPDRYPATKSGQTELRKRLQDNGLVAASLQSAPGGSGFGHPASSVTFVRDDYVDYIKKILEIAAGLGCDAMGVWAGESYGTGPTDISIDFMIDTYAKCAEVAKDIGIPICLEAEPVQLPNHPEVWLKILRGVNSNYMKAICDLAHVNFFTQGKPLDVIKQLQPYIGYTHITDNDQTRSPLESCSSTHLPLGQGTADWKAMLSQILDNGYQGWLDVDVWESRDPFGHSEISKKALDEFLASR